MTKDNAGGSVQFNEKFSFNKQKTERFLKVRRRSCCAAEADAGYGPNGYDPHLRRPRSFMQGRHKDFCSDFCSDSLQCMV